LDKKVIEGNVKAIKKTLESHGFKVFDAVNLNSEQMKSLINSFVSHYGYGKNNRILFYFSGHGYSRENFKKGYIIPIDAPDPKRNDEQDFLANAIHMEDLKTVAKKMEARHILFVFESCFSGTIFETLSSPVPELIKEKIQNKSRQFITAGSAGQKIPSTTLFSRAFCLGLTGEADQDGDGFVTATELFVFIKEQLKKSDVSYKPQYGSLIVSDFEGEFVFFTAKDYRKYLYEAIHYIKIGNYRQAEVKIAQAKKIKSTKKLKDIETSLYFLDPTLRKKADDRIDRDKVENGSPTSSGENIWQKLIKFFLKYKVLIAIVLFVLIGNFAVKKILSMIFHHDIAIDMGSANTLVYVKGKGVVIREPSLVAIEKKTGRIMAIGFMAQGMIGHTPANIEVIRPIKNGVIEDFEITEKMLSYFIRKIGTGPKFIEVRIVIGVPSAITQVERRAVKDAALRAGASEVFLMESTMAAAIGAELPITELGGNMIIDIGSGITDIAVISLSGICISTSIRIGGNEMDGSIIRYIKKKYNLLIGERTAEQIKIGIGSAYPLDENLEMEIKGRDLSHGIPKTITINDGEIREALEGVVQTIVEAVRNTLEKTPPELSADIVDRGIILSGGGSLLRNLDKRLRAETSLPVWICEDPLSSVVLGLGKMVDNSDLLRKIGR
jgi:rod shape-determining protein MreB